MAQPTNPYESPKVAAQPTAEQPSSERLAYNVVTDTVTGPNVRLKDNLIQGLVIFVCLALGILIGAVFYGGEGALIGGFAGLLIGLFGSGAFLMVYRAARHAKGKHD
jgi:hypothetical protein